MFDLIVRIVVRKVLLTTVMLSFAGCLSDWGFGGGDVDLKKATWLVAEKVPLVVDKGGVPVGGGGSVPNTPVNGLFNLKPGTKVSAQALGGAIDPTGTTIVNDFDGDGILNINETTTNVWVADYPDVDTVIAPPITLKIAILKSSTGESDEILSEINSDDLESTTSLGTEIIHQTETNLKTVQFQDQYKSETEDSQATSIENVVNNVVSGSSSNSSNKSTNSWSKRVLNESTTTKWADKPFLNNIDRNATTTKSDSSGKNARKYRAEKSAKVNQTSKVESNAGYVRAALYIKNRTVNMPVKLTNILCTLMFEDGIGNLIPVQSFRLRNDDYSLFQVEVYGGNEFGPYVVELNNLNTAEIERAINSGFTPKIYIVDYSMTHVADSNYKSALLNFNGDNLKIIEENSKGRTSLIKFYGPNLREKYRVAAFDDLSSADPCITTTVSTLSPGVTLKKALERISCSGSKVEFQDYVIDFSELAPALNESKIHVKAIKSFAGIESKLPCNNGTFTGSDGVERTACIQKPTSSWSDSEKATAGVWAIFSKAKYFSYTDYWVDGTNIRIFNPTDPKKIQMVKGVDSIIWAGDVYDIVYISVKDLLNKVVDPTYSSSPVANGEDNFSLNTLWDLKQLGEHPYDPDIHAKNVGKVGFGEKLVFEIKLDKTKYLNPNFGSPENGGTYQIFTNFSYSPIVSTNRFYLDQTLDFEVSLGAGGTRTDWVHIIKDTNVTDPKKIRRVWIDNSGYTDQTFRICLQMPSASDVVDVQNSLVNVYIRPALNSAYRRTIWPLSYTDVKKMRAELDVTTNVGDTTIYLKNVNGNIEQNDSIYIAGDPNVYTVAAPPTITPLAPEGYFTVVLQSGIQKVSAKATLTTIPGTLTAPDVRLIEDNSFVSTWNAQTPASDYNLRQYLPLLNGGTSDCSGVNQFHPFGCLGFTPDYHAINWMGSYNKGVPFWNSWTDAGGFFSFLSGGSFSIGTNGNALQAASVASDNTLSDPSADVPYGEPVSVSSGDAMMVFWKQDTAILGKAVKISDPGTSVLNQFTLATSVGAATELTAKLDSTSGKVTIIWENGLDIYIAIRNFADGAIILAPTKVVTRTSGSRIGLAVGIDRALVTWADIVPIPASWESTRSVKGKIYNATNGTVAINTFNLFTVNSWNNWGYEADADGNGGQYALVSRHWVDTSGNQSNVVNHSVNLSTGAIVNSVTLSSNSVVASNGVNVSAGTNYGLVIYKGASGTWYGRSINLTTGAVVGTSNLAIVTNPAFIRVNAIGDYAYIQYSINGSLQVKVVNLILNSFQNGNALTLSSEQPGAVQRSSKVAVSSEGTLFTAWEHTDGTKKTIRGRTFTLSPWALKGSSEFFLSTKNEGLQTGLPEVGVYLSRALPVWRSEDIATDSIRRFDLDLVNPGSLRYGMNNFFISPLIERDYQIKVTIVP
ncbi:MULTISPECIES: LIC12048 family lipoprotein [unclassified Leptospira]|uniref:LIC12048 family lipoprotein n=1 Tax=unclassified Leptospira TaxID=2633828 RepID=UPI0002BE3F7E|nr:MULTISPECIES: LIC12048 family lipoprotein [unclassified Leptospira]EMK00110.1 putative lipoprotein [Leptospira sp. B5-022]MCR1795618.1 LIC12048 family lipoprotein [Leptospira sp. id769339]